MIKSITIQNFESHEDTTIYFNNGLCLVEGLSNSGKSSIIRSMAAVVNNRWDKSMVRNGFEFCRIKMETEKGWVECERGEKTNRWRCSDENGIQEYKSVGTGVPEQVTKILGMGERKRGDIKELPNFQFQLEKHYMLSEIDGKKATSNMIARMMDNAIGLGGMEDFINALSTDLLKDKRWITEKQEYITELKSSILDDVIFNGYERLMNKINEQNDEIIEIESYLTKAEEKLESIKVLQTNIYNCIHRIKSFDNIDKLVSLQNETKTCQSLVEQVEKLIKINKKHEEASLLSDIDTDKISILTDDIKQEESKIELAESLLAKARGLWKEIKNCKKKIDEDSENLIILSQEFEMMKKELGVCPLCGSDFK